MVIAVPQLFYDLIARVFPGFLFLSMICFLSNVLTKAIAIQLLSMKIEYLETFWGSLYFGIVYFIFSYYTGWILSILSDMWPFHKYGVDKMLLDQYPQELKKNYQKIRLENESVGFRIVKLRAEAKMLEASRTGMCIMVSLMFLLVIYQYEAIDIKQIFLISIPGILALIFQKSIKSAVDRYTKNIEAHYDLMFGKANSIYYSKY